MRRGLGTRKKDWVAGYAFITEKTEAFNAVEVNHYIYFKVYNWETELSSSNLCRKPSGGQTHNTNTHKNMRKGKTKDAHSTEKL